MRSDSLGPAMISAPPRASAIPLLVRLSDLRASPPGAAFPARIGVATSGRPGRPGARWGMGDGADQQGQPSRLARRHSADRPARAPPSRCAADLHRFGRASLSALHHRPSPPGHVRARRDPPPARPGPGSRRDARAGRRKLLPFHSLAANVAWLELGLCAHDAVCSRSTACTASASPSGLRYRILHVAGHSRTTPEASPCSSQPTGLGPEPFSAPSSASKPSRRTADSHRRPPQ